MTTVKNYQTFLPIFSGFYGTIFEPQEDCEIESINSERAIKGLNEVAFDDVKFNYKEYKIEVSKEACNYVETTLNKIGIKCAITFEELISPREYNFSNDSINISIEIDTKSILRYFEAHKKELAQYFADKYTSRSGFISLYSNDINEWMSQLASGDFKVHIISAMLDAILLNEDKESEMNMYYHTSERVYLSATNYSELIEEN